jgi:hypothetical protein
MNLQGMVRCNGCGREWAGGRRPFPEKIAIARRLGIGESLRVAFDAHVDITISAQDAYERQKIESADLCDICRSNLTAKLLASFTGEEAAGAVKAEIIKAIEGIRESLSTHASRTDERLRDIFTSVEIMKIVRSYFEENFGPALDAHMKQRRSRKKGGK